MQNAALKGVFLLHAGETMAQRMERAGRATGFDYLRLGLSLAVVIYHSITSSYGPVFEVAFLTGPWGGVPRLFLPMFFALSGFLVAGSLFRTRTLLHFLSLRGLRILPALTVEIFLSAVLLGGLLTTLPRDQYFADPLFWDYFKNIFGWVHFYLPGVFENNPLPMVNASLWTIPSELECYVALAFLALIGLTKRPLAFLAATVALVVAMVVQGALSGAELYGHQAPGRLLVGCFLAGVAFYLNRARVRMNLALFVLALGVSWLCFTLEYARFLAIFPIAYATIYLGLLRPRLPKLIERGDYSYGIYLYSYPIQQTYTHLFPDHRVWYLNLAFSMPIIVLLAAFSWHVVEANVMKLKKYVVRAPEPRRSVPGGAQASAGS